MDALIDDFLSHAPLSLCAERAALQRDDQSVLRERVVDAMNEHLQLVVGRAMAPVAISSSPYARDTDTDTYLNVNR